MGFNKIFGIRAGVLRILVAINAGKQERAVRRSDADEVCICVLPCPVCSGVFSVGLVVR